MAGFLLLIAVWAAALVFYMAKRPGAGLMLVWAGFLLLICLLSPGVFVFFVMAALVLRMIHLGNEQDEKNRVLPDEGPLIPVVRGLPRITRPRFNTADTGRRYRLSSLALYESQVTLRPHTMMGDYIRRATELQVIAAGSTGAAQRERKSLFDHVFIMHRRTPSLFPQDHFAPSGPGADTASEPVWEFDRRTATWVLVNKAGSQGDP